MIVENLRGIVLATEYLLQGRTAGEGDDGGGHGGQWLFWRRE